MINIKEVSKPRREQTKKELRNGANKWKLSHLPADADRDAFTKYVTPLAKIKAGMLDPWEGLSTAQVQRIVDDIYGPGHFSVDDDDVWCGLVSPLSFIPPADLPDNLIQIAYRLQSWRNAFATAASNIVKARIEEEDTLTPAEIAEAMDVYLSPVGIPPTYPYFWRDWEIHDGTVKKTVRNNGLWKPLIVLTDSKGSLPEFGSHWHVCISSCCGIRATSRCQ
jgi:hypothetical protein